MAYEVEVTDEWLAWFEELTVEEQEELAASIGLLEAKGTPSAVSLQQWGDLIAALAQCASYVPRCTVDLFGHCTRSILEEWRSC